MTDTTKTEQEIAAMTDEQWADWMSTPDINARDLFPETWKRNEDGSHTYLK